MTVSPASDCIYRVFLDWARHQNIQTDGITLARIPGQGLGIVATSPLKEGQKVCFVPTSAFVHAAWVERLVGREAIEGLSVHGFLAAGLLLDAASEDPQLEAWTAIWPSMEDFDEELPLRWSLDLQSQLPPAAKDILAEQQRQLWRDYEAVIRFSPAISYDDYVYYWLVVNTRSFAYTKGGTNQTRTRGSAADNMAVCPFIDLFNFANEGCQAINVSRGYTVWTDRDYEAGEQLFLRYGNHSNDSLLVNYGFMLSPIELGTTDYVKLDHLILPILCPNQQEILKEAGYLGNYILNPVGEICFRTQVVLRLLSFSPVAASGIWEAFKDGRSDGEAEQPVVNQFLVPLLERFDEQAREILIPMYDAQEKEFRERERVQGGSGIRTCEKKTPEEWLYWRWIQIMDVLELALERLGRVSDDD
ncbi:MAG: hypothetical protein M1823_002814 [Watsoniomyces obsoletus]|nr:MAG: hypothetical protein M1823_002814 [Watsoniomyces obsoletus]